MNSKPESLAELLKSIQSLQGKDFDPITKHLIIHAVLKYRGNYTFSCGAMSKQLDIPLRTVQKKMLVLKQMNLFIFSHYLEPNIKGVHPVPCYSFNRKTLDSILTNAVKTLVELTNAPDALVISSPTNAAPALVENPMNSTNAQLAPQLAPDMRYTNEDVQKKSTKEYNNSTINNVPGTGKIDLGSFHNEVDAFFNSIPLPAQPLVESAKPLQPEYDWRSDKPQWELDDRHVPDSHKKKGGLL